MSKDESSDSGLAHLKEQTTHVMIPLLIKAFELRSEAQQKKHPSNSLYPLSSTEEVSSQLRELLHQLSVQKAWLDSSTQQIEKILLEIQQTPSARTTTHIPANLNPHPSIKRYFIQTFSTRTSLTSSPWKRLWKKLWKRS